ncbi:MAG: asparaginase [Anaerolineales bacterium]|nr:asparaginase [Anaerolineales bacterium]
MPDNAHLPLFELTRGLTAPEEQTVESVHYGAIAVADARGRLLAWYGDPQMVTYLRSTAKPFQALPFIESKGHEHYGLTPREIAVICASHSGSDEHVSVVREIQRKTGVKEEDLLCGVHPISHEETLKAMAQRGEALSPNRHNCSGKHTGMLASARMRHLPTQDYISADHPLQVHIRETFAEMCVLPTHKVMVGIDGCSAPNFAVPLFNAALGFARLCDPTGGEVAPAARQAACNAIVQAMTSHPDMVAGPGRFDTLLMQAGGGKILSKGGAEGYQGIGLLPGALSPGSPALGIAIKISDGDPSSRAVRATSLEVLRQLGALSPAQLESLQSFGPRFPVTNWRKLAVGVARPCFTLQRSEHSLPGG